MFKLNKHKSDRFRDKLDFKFSSFQAIQVPKGWDKLVVSVVSVETGKTISKSGKASVKNGTCRWSETFSESICISQENGDSNELDGNHVKFVVSMGSSRSGILGEVAVNLGEYASSKTVNSLALQLKKCNYIISLQFRIQCLTPKAKYRDALNKETNIHVEYGNPDHDDIETKSDASDGAFSRSAGSTSSNYLESTSVARATFSRDPSLSASDSRHSYESTEAFSGKDIFSPPNNVNNHIERQDSVDSQNNGPQKELNSSVMSSPSSRAGSSKDLLEAAEVTIEELRAEARMWERNSKKLMMDMDGLKKELSDHSRNQETLNMELSASQQECNGLKQEVKHLNSLLEESAQRLKAEEELKLRDKDKDGAQQEMEEEIRFLKESNADLADQLQKTQDSNIELLTILQELEGIVETQKTEIQELSSQKLKLEESVKLGPSKEVSSDSSPEEINNIKVQLEQLQEIQEELESAIRELEKTVVQKDNEIETERELRMDSESKWKIKVSEKEGEIMNLEAKLSGAVKEQGDREFELGAVNATDLANEIENLRTKVQELENDCNELTEENLQLLLKFKGTEKDFSSDDLVDSSCGSPDCTCGTKVSKLRTQLLQLRQELRDKEALIECVANSAQSQVLSLDFESKCGELETELQSFKEKTIHLEDELQNFRVRVEEQQSEVHELQRQLKHYQGKETESRDLDTLVTYETDKIKQNLEIINSKEYANKSDHLKEEESEDLRKQLSTLENQILGLRNENCKLQESLESEKNTSADTSEELKKKILMVERLSSEMEKGKEEVEQQLSELEKENMQLTERISALEAQLRYLTNEKEACQRELEDSKTLVTNLRDEMKRLETDMEAEKIDTEQKLQNLQNRWLEAQEECEFLKQANPKLQSTAENLIEECTSLQIYNGDLKRKNMELLTRYSAIESQLRDSTSRFAECSQKVEALEAEFSVMAEEFSLKEQSLKSELDSLIVADREYKEKIMQENVSLNNMYSQKVVEVEKIQGELAHLIDQISVAQSEQVTMLELSALRTDKAKLEVSLQQLQRQFVRSESKLSESDAQLQELTKELKSSRRKQEALMADHDKVLKLLESYKSNEAKHKSTIHGLEKDIKTSGYEKVQLAEEVSSLKEQLQRANSLQGEILTLKTSLNHAKFESEKAKTSWDLLRGEHEKLKNEKDYLAQRISSAEKALPELEECQRSRINLEEKVLRLEGDLAAREALCLQDVELKFELNKVKRVNGELKRKIKHLEQDQEEHLRRVKALKKQLKRKNQAIHDGIKSVSDPSDLEDEPTSTESSSKDDKQLLRASEAAVADYSSKIETLENELAEALEANEMYKSQLKRFLSEQKKSGHRKKPDVSALEAELKELRERYFQMSLKYAEVEAQREELVLKLKSTTNKRRWF